MPPIVGALVCAAVVALGTASALAVSATGPRSPEGESSVAPDEATNEHAAEADAAALLGTLTLPAGAIASSTEPAGDGGALASAGLGPPATPNVVDDRTWWIVPGSSSATLAFVRSHPPAGAAPAGSDRGAIAGETTFESQTFAWPARAGVLSTRWLVVTVAQLSDGSTGVRLDAQVVWVTPRAASERIPAGAHRLAVSPLSEIKGGAAPAQRPFSVDSPKRIAAVVALLNSLPVAQPGLRSCPLDLGIIIRLAFYARGSSAPAAVARIDPGGCRGVQLTIGGKLQPPLDGEALPATATSHSAPLLARIGRLLGVTIKTGPS